jgi:hypothetical protein
MAASLERLQSLWRKGEIGLDTLVWTEGMPKRERVRAVASLRGTLEESNGAHQVASPGPGTKPAPAWGEAHAQLRVGGGAGLHYERVVTAKAGRPSPSANGGAAEAVEESDEERKGGLASGRAAAAEDAGVGEAEGEEEGGEGAGSAGSAEEAEAAAGAGPGSWVRPGRNCSRHVMCCRSTQYTSV